MPFLNLDNNWSNLAPLYNQAFANRPTVPVKVNQYVTFDDGFIRGGTINAYLATAQDVVRIGKFLTGLSNINRVTDFKDTTLQTATKGILFLTKQVGLQQANPRLEWEGQPSKTTPYLGGVTRQFTGAGTILSIGGSAFGLHFDRAGLLGKIRDNQKYGGDIDSPTSGVVWQNNFGNGNNSNLLISKKSQNRLVRYLAKIAPPLSVRNPNDPVSYLPGSTDPIKALEIIDDEGNKVNGSDSKILDSYSGGYKSVYGLGISTIRTFKDSKTIIDLSDLGVPGIPPSQQIIPGGSYQSIANPNYKPPQTTTTPGKILKKKVGKRTIISETFESTATVYSPNTISQWVDVTKTESIAGTPGQTGTNPGLIKKLNGFSPFANSQIIQATRADVGTYESPSGNLEKILSGSLRYWNRSVADENIEKRIGVSSPKQVDAINVINITDSETFYVTNKAGGKTPNTTVTDLSAYSGKIDGYYGRDIINFRIEFLNNDEPISSGGTRNTDVLAFRAYIDDFTDGMTAKWNPYRYMGRGEEFYVYDGFTRDIGVSFTMFAHSPKEMKPLYNKLNYLMSSFAPDYTSANKMRGNIGYLTVGDYIYRQPGVFTDIKLSGMLDAHWELSLNKPEKGDDKDQYEVPKMIKVGLSFKPIHTFLPRRPSSSKTSAAPFITPDKIYKGYTGGTNKYLD
jgi:hypothetical protein